MLVSVIIPYFNDESNISLSVNSVLNQKYKNTEIIIIDDENSKNSKKILNTLRKKSKKIKIITNKVNMGVAKSRNKGIKFSKGKLIAFIDSDDLWHQNKLSEQISLINKNKIDVCYTNYSVMDNNKILYKTRPPKSLVYSEFLKECPISCSSVILKKEVLRGIKFRDLKTKEDYMLWLDLSKQGLKFFGLDKYFTFYRVRSGSLSGKHFVKLYSAFKIYFNYLNYNLIYSLGYTLRLYMHAIKKKYINRIKI